MCSPGPPPQEISNRNRSDLGLAIWKTAQHMAFLDEPHPPHGRVPSPWPDTDLGRIVGWRARRRQSRFPE